MEVNESGGQTTSCTSYAPKAYVKTATSKNTTIVGYQWPQINSYGGIWRMVLYIPPTPITTYRIWNTSPTTALRVLPTLVVAPTPTPTLPTPVPISPTPVSHLSDSGSHFPDSCFPPLRLRLPYLRLRLLSFRHQSSIHQLRLLSSDSSSHLPTPAPGFPTPAPAPIFRPRLPSSDPGKWIHEVCQDSCNRQVAIHKSNL